jgi:hypothetical protein
MKGAPRMTEHSHPESKHQVPSQKIEDANGHPLEETESEFRLTIRKLELPVRPRGVLAD